jgi:hypothetical protein
LQSANPGYFQKTNGFNNNTNLFYIFLTNSQKCLNILTFMFTFAGSLLGGEGDGERERGKIVLSFECGSNSQISNRLISSKFRQKKPKPIQLGGIKSGCIYELLMHSLPIAVRKISSIATNRF